MSTNLSLDPKKRGLGRGLDALFESKEEDYAQIAEDSNSSGLQKKVVGIEQLVPNPAQPRKTFRQEALEELASSLKEYGILQPLLVRPKQGAEELYEIIAGERRWRASQIAQLHEIPVVVRELTDSEALQIGLVENLQREDLNPVEEALGYQKLIEEFGHTQQKVAALVGKSRSQVTNMLRLLGLPQSILNMLENGEITTGHARALIGKENAEDLAKEIRDKDISVREIEELVSNSAVKDSKSSAKPVKDSDTRALEKEISDTLGMLVNINVRNGSHKGNVKISFKSLDQLDFLLHKLSRN